MKTVESKTVGNHLTVIKYTDGTADLSWDWDALLDEVRMATAKSPEQLQVLDKLDMERMGRRVDVELDRRKKKTTLATELKTAIDADTDGVLTKPKVKKPRKKKDES